MTGRLYDGDQVIAEYDETGTVTAQFVHGPGLGADVGSMICSESIDNGSVAVEWFCYNWRGDVICVTDGGGAVLCSYRYDAFGQVIGEGMPGRGFSSKEYNERTSLSYFGARYYDASIGRFISRDPLGFVDGPNEYIYCANNPIGCVDPWGLSKRFLVQYSYELAPENKPNLQGESPDPPDPPHSHGSSVAVKNTVTMLTGWIPTITPYGPGPPFPVTMYFNMPTIDKSESDSQKATGKKNNKNPRKIIEGVYKFIDSTGKYYIGQSKDILKRLKQHIQAKKLLLDTPVEIIEVLGGKIEREKVEYFKLRETTGNVRAKDSDIVSMENRDRHQFISICLL